MIQRYALALFTYALGLFTYALTLLATYALGFFSVSDTVSSFVPKRPAGLMSRTSAITRYGARSPIPRPRKDSSLWYPVAKDSVTPTIRPPASAPVVESSPPRIAAGKALSAASEVARSSPGVGKTVRKSAATAASAPATAQAASETRPRRTPISAAVSGFSAAARIDTPHEVYRNASRNTVMSRAAETKAAIRVCAMVMSPMVTTWSPHGSPSARTSVPIRRVSSVVRRMSTPMVTMARTLWSEPR